MKKLEELGISPAPWKIRYGDWGDWDVVDANNEIVAEYQFSNPDTILIAAAPAMYSEGYDDCLALRAIVRKMDDGMVILNLRDTLAKMADRIEAALAEAAGESEAIHGE